jgi:three-Cys-motif partner protein
MRCGEISTEPDGLYTPVVGRWSEEKYMLLANYAQVFATSMKDKWEDRVYIDLFAGAGQARIRDSTREVLCSPLLALAVDHPFDHYIFCDADPICVEALQTRVRKIAPNVQAHYITEDANEAAEEILRWIPQYSKEHKVLTFCFVDPYSLSNLRFETLKKLSTRFVDFLVHLPAMDPIRNRDIYSADNDIVDRFLGDSTWRAVWEQEKVRSCFPFFIAQQFNLRMRKLGYAEGIKDSVFVRSTSKNLPLYRLGFFTRHPLGTKFWKEVKRCNDSQLPLL